MLSHLLFGEVIDGPNIKLPNVRNLRIHLLARCAGGALRQFELQVINDARRSVFAWFASDGWTRNDSALLTCSHPDLIA